MKYGKEIGFIGLIVSAMAFFKINNAIESSKKSWKELAEKEVVKNRSEDNQDLIIECERLTHAKKKIVLEEKDIKAKRLNKFTEENGYDKTMDRIAHDISLIEDEVKQEIGYSEKKLGYQNAAEKAITDYKKTQNYDYKLNELNSQINNIKTTADAKKRQCDMMVSFGGPEEAVKQVKDTKKKIEKTCKSDCAVVQEKIDAMKSKLNDVEKETNSVCRESIRKLDLEVNEKVVERSKDLREERSKIKSTLLAEESRVENEILNSRTEEQKDIFNTQMDLQKKVNALIENEKAETKRIVNNTTGEVKLARYLSENGYSRSEVVMIGSLPMIPILYFVGRYFYLLATVVKEMK